MTTIEHVDEVIADEILLSYVFLFENVKRALNLIDFLFDICCS